VQKWYFRAARRNHIVCASWCARQMSKRPHHACEHGSRSFTKYSIMQIILIIMCGACLCYAMIDPTRCCCYCMLLGGDDTRIRNVIQIIWLKYSRGAPGMMQWGKKSPARRKWKTSLMPTALSYRRTWCCMGKKHEQRLFARRKASQLFPRPASNLYA
jgi:hypothetical protein